MIETRARLPRARKDKLVTTELEGEKLIYDEKNDKAHCLNRTAAIVWEHCDGRTTVEEMARLLEIETKNPVSNEVIWFALRQLEKSNLVEKPVTRPVQVAGMSRREMVRRLGIAAAVALPLVTTIIAPTAVDAATCATGGQPCSAGIPCCPGFNCVGAICQAN
ncbi:MAG TPA: PqqD family protein [Pyrinomonadaceae bacterium]|nr:PqqD family protein [Pyrinomonadaceae bacterium]